MRRIIKIGIILIFMIIGIILIPKEEQAVTYKNSSSTIQVTINGTDANYNGNSLTADNVTVKVGGTAVTLSTKSLSSATSITNGVQYVLTLSGVTGNGDLTLEIGANTLSDKSGNQNIVNTINTGITMDNSGLTYSSSEIKNITTTGYDVYVYGVGDSYSGVNTVRFPTWTQYNGNDDIASNWSANSATLGTNQGSGTWYFRVNRSAHNNEFGLYDTHIYLYDNLGNYTTIVKASNNVPGTVSYNANGGSVSTTSKQIFRGSAYGTLPVPTRTGYTFNGWYTAASGGSKVESTTTVTSVTDHTLYAQWTINTYTITFNGNGGTSITKTGTYGSTITLPTSTWTQYVFNGWYTASGETSGSQITSLTATQNITYYAHWVQIPKIYYNAHITNIGWQGNKYNGATSGTIGQSLPIQCIRVYYYYDYTNWQSGVRIEYIVAVENGKLYPSGLPWGTQSPSAASDGADCGTTGQNLAIKNIYIAIKDTDTGKDSKYFDVWYESHVANRGWLSWTRNGWCAGDGINQQEAFKVVIKEKGNINPDGNSSYTEVRTQ